MKLSFVMCSNRRGLEVVSRIGRLAALASDEIEVVVRDNSGDPEKQDWLARMQGPNRKIVSVPTCPSWENMLNALNLASGDYIFEIHDDDDINILSVPAFLETIRQMDPDPSCIAATGRYLLEMGDRNEVYEFDKFDAPTAKERVTAYMAGAHSVLHFSAIRRSVRSHLDAFNRSLPFRFSYLDQIQAGLLLCSGRMLTMPRQLYTYDFGNWTNVERGRRADMGFFRDSGVDTSAMRFKNLIMAFEGAKAIASKFEPLTLPAEERFDIARHWFVSRYGWFIGSPGEGDQTARFDRQAVALAEKWRSIQTVDFGDLLADLSEFFALSDPAAGQRYHDFWA